MRVCGVNGWVANGSKGTIDLTYISLSLSLSLPPCLVFKAHNKSAAQVALRWVVQQGIVAATASKEKEYDETDLELWDFALTDAEMKTLSALQ
jgi:hypothetical protein